MESVSKNRENTMNSLEEKNMADPLLKVDHVTICYNGEPTVQDVSFELRQGEILGIVGESRKQEKVRTLKRSWDFWEKKVW